MHASSSTFHPEHYKSDFPHLYPMSPKSFPVTLGNSVISCVRSALYVRLRVLHDADTVPERWWGKPAMYMSQVTVRCLSVRHFQHIGQTARHRTELCPTALSVMLGHTAITLLLHNTGPECSPPTHTHKYIYARTHTHTFWLRLSSKFTCHSTFNNHTLHICRQHNHSEDSWGNQSCSAPHLH